MRHVIWYTGYDVILDDIVRAEGCSLFDSEGREYLDFESGVWCTSIGHSNPRVLAAIAEQSARIAHNGFSYGSPVVEEAAREILGLLGFDGGSAVFLCSGSEAVEYGVRAAQAFSDRPLLMIMADSYCGAYGSASRKQPEEWFTFDWTECAECQRPGECDGGCDRWATVPWDRIGGFLLEPGSSSGFVRFPPEKLVRAIAKKLAETGGYFLVNEVTTGVGRTGEWFGYQRYGVTPDIVGMGKGIGNGYPVSVTAFAPRVAERLRETPLPYAQSHQNDPLGAAVVRAVVGFIRDQDLIANVRTVSDQFRRGLEEIRARTGRIADVRGRGLLIAVDLADEQDAPAFAARVHREMVRRGFIFARRPGTGTVRLDPPLTIGAEQVARFLDAFGSVLEEA
jgi:acetylornithine aminotransferase